MIYPNLALKKKSHEGDYFLRSKRIWMIVMSIILMLVVLLCLYGAEGASFEYAILNAAAITTNSGGLLDYAGYIRGQVENVEPILVYSDFTMLFSAIAMIVARLEFVFVFSLSMLFLNLGKAQN